MDNVELDKVLISKEEFALKLEESNAKGIKLLEVSPGVYKTLKKLRD